jgi:hypothetical protein
LALVWDKVERFGPSLEAQMIQFALTTGQAVADLTRRLGLGQLAEHHGHELTPATEAVGRFLRTAFFDSPGELVSVDQQKHLAKKARMSYHLSSLRGRFFRLFFTPTI